MTRPFAGSPSWRTPLKLHRALKAGEKNVVVAVGFAEALSAPEVVWSLIDAGLAVIAFARRGRHAALRQSRHVTVQEITAPETDSQAARQELEALVAAQAAGGRHVVLFPLDDASLWLGDKLPLAERGTLAGASGSQAALALDKWRQVQVARAAGFNVPDSFVMSDQHAGEPGRFPQPVILRPAKAVAECDGRLARGRNRICSDEEELQAALAAWRGKGTLLVQPYIAGTGEGVFGLATGQGVKGWSAHRRLRMMNPHGSGSSACVSQPVPADAKAATERFVEQAGWRGLFMVELLRDAAGKLWFVEFNGRPWGSMALSRRQGLEYPAWAVACALNPDSTLNVQPSCEQRVVCRNAGREFMHLLFVLRGPKSRALHPWPSFWRTALDLLAVRRGEAFYNWRRDDPKVFFSDWWCTMRDNLYKARN